MSDRLTATGVVFGGAEPSGQPARAVLVKRRVSERRIDSASQSDQDAAARVEEPCDRGDLSGIEPLDIGQNHHSLPFQIVGSESINPDDARPDRDGVGPVGSKGRRRKSVSLDSGSTPGSPSTSKTGSAAVTSIARLDSSSSASASPSPVRRTDRACEPGSAIDVRNDSGISPPGGSGPTTWAIPRTTRPSTLSSAVHVSKPGPALETLVVIVIGRLGVINPPESSSGPTDPFGSPGPAFVSKLIAQMRGDTPDRRVMS